jgi:hypothetical protein
MTQIANCIEQFIDQQISEKDVVAFGVLNWGLGHATRCIPIIHFLRKRCKKVVICSDGQALQLLKLEFPEMVFYELPSYQIDYRFESMVLNLLFQFPFLVYPYLKEASVSRSIAKQTNASVFISDNRFAFRSVKTKNIYISHQITILHKFVWVSWLASYVHGKIIKKYDTCWVPDWKGENSISGKLSESKDLKNLKYFGPITRVKKLDLEKSWDICVILSGPEPQRTKLELDLFKEMSSMTQYKILFIRGSDVATEMSSTNKHIKLENICNSKKIETALNSSKLLISRPGYTTMMDIASLDLIAILVPTPGQTEQEYLANRWDGKQNYTQVLQKDVAGIGNLIYQLLEQKQH